MRKLEIQGVINYTQTYSGLNTCGLLWKIAQLLKSHGKWNEIHNHHCGMFGLRSFIACLYEN